jgi:hypothetical protein
MASMYAFGRDQLDHKDVGLGVPNAVPFRTTGNSRTS